MSGPAQESNNVARPLRVTWFIPVTHRDYNKMPASVWIRCLQLIPYLEERGIQCRVNDEAAQADVAVFIRCQDESAFELARRMKAKGVRVVFDLCVNYFDEAKIPSIGIDVSKELVSQCLRMISAADAVTVSSSFIAQRAREHHDVVEYLPDSIDARHFKRKKSTEDLYRPTIRAIWSGVSAKASELEPLFPLLKRRRIELAIITDSRPRLRSSGHFLKRGFPFDFVQWRYETFPTSILSGELCISHRPVEDPYTRGHSFFKIGVFMAEGVPSLVSPVPSYMEILSDGSGGRVCHTLDEWESALDAVMEDRMILEKWSHEAALRLQPYYTATIANRYVDFLRRLDAA